MYKNDTTLHVWMTHTYKNRWIYTSYKEELFIPDQQNLTSVRSRAIFYVYSTYPNSVIEIGKFCIELQHWYIDTVNLLENFCCMNSHSKCLKNGRKYFHSINFISPNCLVKKMKNKIVETFL